jgi:hypothetical protein
VAVDRLCRAIAGWTVLPHARRLSTSGVALADEVVPVPRDSDPLALSVREPAARRADEPRCAARAGQEQAQSEHGHRPDHDAVKERGAGRAGDVVAEHREPVGERMCAALIGEDAGHANDYRGDEQDKAEYEDHDALR